MPDKPEFILKATCPVGSGIVAAVTTCLAQHGCYISELHHFDDEANGRLFMRCRFRVDQGDADQHQLETAFADVAQALGMDWKIVDAGSPTRTLIMVSRHDHCLDDLLYRHRKGELNMAITAVVSNHETLQDMAAHHGIPFIHLPVTPETKPDQEASLGRIIDETASELVVLARYMQVLSDEFCERLPGRIINIHHSFLPGFKGARPYHQAFDRGVKLIGATAHYVTADLDEGPIICQAVQAVDHTYSPDMLVAVGRDTETKALADAVRLHTEHRAFVDGNKTVVFN